MTLADAQKAPARREDAGTGASGICLECGAANPRSGEFCSDPHRKAWHNRRMTRGAELYDLFMAHRFDRARAVELGLLGMMNRMASLWREEDREHRGARRTWRKAVAVLAGRPWLFATVFHPKKRKRQ